MFANLIKKVRLLFLKDKQLHFFFYKNFGFVPRNTSLYVKALCHKSYSREVAMKNGLDNERLEFLGDVVLDLIVADVLYKKYPGRNEGFLTRMKSAIVCRKSLNHIASEIGLGEISHVQKSCGANLLGNILESLIAAVYLDKGYEACYRFVLHSLLDRYIVWSQLEQEPISYKSQLLEWAQKHRKDVSFAFREFEDCGVLWFECEITIEGNVVSKSVDRTKREASQKASFIAVSNLDIQKGGNQ